MAMKILRNFTVFAAVATAALPGVATAQTIPTAFQVGTALDVGCATTPNGQLIDLAACLAAIEAAVGVAEQYAGAGGDPTGLVPPQLDIGYYLCQLGIRVPDVYDEIIDAIEDAFNINLRSGCQDAIDGVTPPPPPPPPISKN